MRALLVVAVVRVHLDVLVHLVGHDDVRSPDKTVMTIIYIDLYAIAHVRRVDGDVSSRAAELDDLDSFVGQQPTSTPPRLSRGPRGQRACQLPCASPSFIPSAPLRAVLSSIVTAARECSGAALVIGGLQVRARRRLRCSGPRPSSPLAHVPVDSPCFNHILSDHRWWPHSQQDD